VSIYGTFVPGDYIKIQHHPGQFAFGEFSPQFLVQLNNWILMESEISVGADGDVGLGRAQIDFIVNDWLTVVAGLFESPLGFYNERLIHPWYNKFPDDPLMFRQVSPADLTLLGVQLRGAHYLGCSPVKLEYALFVSNGLELNKEKPEYNDFVDLGGLKDTFNVVTNDKAWGGRLGLRYPEYGLTAGLSGFVNGDYFPGAEDDIAFWSLDAGYHKGNWDVRLEYAQLYQHARTFIGNNVRRQGMYAQVAYRPFDADCALLRNFEAAARFSYAQFNGIDLKRLDLGAFDDPRDAPVD